MSYILTIFTADDASLGRPSKATLSQQTLMELFVADIDDVEQFHDSIGEFMDIDQWDGVQMSENGNVISIDWDRDILAELYGTEDFSVLETGGSIDFQWLPETIVGLSASNLLLLGTVDTIVLPRGLQSVGLIGNELTGSFTIEYLPPKIKRVSIGANDFEGTLNLPALPRNIEVFEVSSNRFSGSLNLSELPQSLKRLDISHNLFSQKVNLTKLPPRLRTLSLHANQIQQEYLVIGDFPEELGGISVDKGKFGTIIGTNGLYPCIEQTYSGLYIRRNQDREVTGPL